MSDNFLEQAWNYAINDLHTQYKNEGKEKEFIFNFNMNYVEDNNETITVSANSQFLKQFILSNGIIDIVQNKLREITGQNGIKIDLIVKTEEVSSSPVLPQIEINEEKEEEPSIFSEPDLDNIKFSSSKPVQTISEDENNDFTFDTFVYGDNNEYAYKAALEVSKNPGKKFSPILFYGGSGLGKTHLMKAIGNYISKNNKDKLKICYVSAENFGNDFTNSLSSKKINDFKNKYRSLDVLLIDDIHFLQNKEGMQAELFYTFEALHQKKAQMVFTCDRPIKEIKNMTDRLVSRLSNGLCINLDPPNYETRIAILNKKVQLQGRTLDSEIIDYIAKNVETNVRELEAALNRIFGYADFLGKNPTLEIVKSQLKDIFSSSSNENISIDTIQKVIALNYQISVSDLKSIKRDKKFAIPRQIAVYIAREMTGKSYSELGNEFGGKDHTTIMHSCDKIGDLIKVDPSLDSKIKLYMKEIKEYKE